MIRLQGKDFADMKPQLEIIGYSVSTRGHYCAFMKLENSNDERKKYIHWLNPEEAERFVESDFYKNNKALTEAQICNMRNKSALRNEIYHILESLNNLVYNSIQAQNAVDGKKKKLYNNYTEELIKEVFDKNKDKFIWLKDMEAELEELH